MNTVTLEHTFPNYCVPIIIYNLCRECYTYRGRYSDIFNHALSIWTTTNLRHYQGGVAI